MRLRLDGRTLAPARAPHGSNGDLVLVEGVVEVAGQLSEVETAQAWDTSGGVRCPGTRKERQETLRPSSNSVAKISLWSLFSNHQIFSRVTCRCAVAVNRTRRGFKMILDLSRPLGGGTRIRFAQRTGVPVGQHRRPGRAGSVAVGCQGRAAGPPSGSPPAHYALRRYGATGGVVDALRTGSGRKPL